MKIKFNTLLILLLLSFNLFSQKDIRDKYVGTYICIREHCVINQTTGNFDCDTTQSSIRVEKAIDINQIKVYEGANTYYEILTKENDSLFISYSKSYRNIGFHNPDSVMYGISYSSMGYRCYNGTKEVIYINETNLSDNNITFTNPFENVINIKLETTEATIVKLININGNVLFSKIYNNSYFQISSSQFSNGIYFLLIISDNSIKTFKLIKY